MRKPELLCPAGGMTQLKTALHFGADAVYGGMKQYGLRAFAGNFSKEELAQAVACAHASGARFYVTLNIFPFDDQMAGFVQSARDALECGVDAAIVSDLGAICMLRSEVPELPLHVSTQASCCNSAAVKHYAALGCRRVILAREFSLERMREMRKQIPEDMELETFVHGAACMAWSGRCLLSSALTGRSGNQGECAQSCRWQYAVMEQKRPGEYLPVAEDLNGTYIFSAKDLNLMAYLPQLCEAGISSLKIEGRMKTEYYTATVTLAYRRALDLLFSQGEVAFREKLPDFLQELKCASHRDSDTGFLLGAPEVPGGAEGFHQDREYIARACADSAAGERASFIMKNRFMCGDTLELMHREGVSSFTAGRLLRKKTGEVLDTFGIAGEEIGLEVPFAVHEGDLLRGQVRNHRT
ncbi:MAG: U32 family peptidase [Clostridia bacterium]|nr:U32 family peptidase [Clostridia bacterium]